MFNWVQHQYNYTLSEEQIIAPITFSKQPTSIRVVTKTLYMSRDVLLPNSNFVLYMQHWNDSCMQQVVF